MKNLLLTCAMLAVTAAWPYNQMSYYQSELQGTRERLTSQQKNNILALHNYYRGFVSPPASDMLRMEWDSDLASIAQSYAEKCIWGRNYKRSDNYPGYVGENLFVTYAAKIDVGAVVTGWYDEVKNYDYDSNRCKHRYGCLHYKQVVSATSTKLGCGTAFCPTMKRLNWINTHIVVCNYSPGAYSGRKLYTTGRSCSECPSGTSCFDNICTKADAVQGTYLRGYDLESGKNEVIFPPTDR